MIAAEVVLPQEPLTVFNEPSVKVLDEWVNPVPRLAMMPLLMTRSPPMVVVPLNVLVPLPEKVRLL